MIDKEDYVFTLKKRILRIRSKGHNGDLTTNISIRFMSLSKLSHL